MTIAAFNRTNLATLRGDMQRALDEVAKKHGISISVDNARFTAQNVKITVNAAVVSKSGAAVTPERQALELRFPGLADKTIWLRAATGKINGKIVGYAARKRKYPFIVKAEDGRDYIVDYDTVMARVA